MRTPSFWYAKRGFKSELLVPFSVLYFLALRLREKWISSPQKVAAKVLCIGNATAGGAGKTPLAMAVAQQWQAMGANVAFLSRGYGRKDDAAMRVDPLLHTAAQVGDEPLLLAQVAPCYVARTRLHAAQMAVADGFTHLVMDDGLQHYSVHKDATLMVVDGQHGFGNGLLIPAGPLRDRVDITLRSVNAVVMVGKDAHGVQSQLPSTMPCWQANPQLVGIPADVSTRKYIAFTGLGLPEKFFTLLRNHGVEPLEAIPFADHHNYPVRDREFLKQLAVEHQATLMTTTKDAIKWPAAERAQLTVVDLQLTWVQPKLLEKFLKDHL